MFGVERRVLHHHRRLETNGRQQFQILGPEGLSLPNAIELDHAETAALPADQWNAQKRP